MMKNLIDLIVTDHRSMKQKVIFGNLVPIDK